MKTAINRREAVLYSCNQAHGKTAKKRTLEEPVVSLAAPQSQPLTDEERADFDRYGARFKEIENTWMEFGEAILDIRERRLYRGEYKTFEAFCRNEIAMGKSNVNRQLQCSQVAKHLATNVAIPLLEGHVRPLLRLNDPAKQVLAFQQAVDQAKKENKPLTALHVTRAVRESRTAEEQVSQEAPTPVTKADVITRIMRAIINGLEKLSTEELRAFEAALKEFKEKWLGALPPTSSKSLHEREDA